jgi:hypothetical protein
MELRFSDHPSFHRAAAGMVGSALLFGAALRPVTELAPIAGGVLGIAVGGAIAYSRPAVRLAIAGAALALLVALPPSWSAAAVVSAVASLALAVGGPRGLRGVVGAAIAAGFVMIALWCAVRIGQAQGITAWPDVLASATAAAAMALVGALAALPRHLAVVREPAQSALGQLPAKLDAR